MTRGLQSLCFYLSDPVVSSSRTAATCGGDSVCLVDCETGIVLKKYKVTGEVRETQFLSTFCFLFSGTLIKSFISVVMTPDALHDLILVLC